MATSSMTKVKGLFTFQNYLSNVPEGALFEASNVVIDRDGVIEPRRGFKVFEDIPYAPKQLLNYKNNVLVHYDNALAYSPTGAANFTTFKTRKDFLPVNVDISTNKITIPVHGLVENDIIYFSNTGGALPSPLTNTTPYLVKSPTQNDFQLKANVDSLLAIDLTTIGTGLHTASYDAIINEVTSEQRIRGLEANGNFFVTSQNGIKKISALNPYAISDAGGIRALDLSLSLDFTSTVGFLDSLKEASYRITWITTDVNGNLIEGVPSYSSTIYNSSASSRNVFVEFIVPTSVTTDYSFRIYRSQQADLGGANDECKLVYEEKFNPNATYYNDATRTITILDEQFDALRDSGVSLYTNEFSGDGILQANYAPPTSRDIASYQNYTFYANTSSNYKLNTTLLGQDGLKQFTNSDFTSIVYGSGVTTFTMSSNQGLTTQKVVLVGSVALDNTYTATVISAPLAPTVFTIPVDLSTMGTKWSLFTSFVTITKGSSSFNYYFVGRPDINKITVGSNGAAIGGKYFNINSFDNKIPYYVWFNDTTVADSAPVNVNVASPAKVSYVAHPFIVDEQVVFTEGTLPTGLSVGTFYYVRNPGANDFELSLTAGGVSINTTGTASVDAKIKKTSATPTADPDISNRVGLAVDYDGSGAVPDTTASIAIKLGAALDSTGDFRTTVVGSEITVETANNGFADLPTNPLADLTGWTFTNLQEGFGEDSTKQYVRLSGLTSPAARIEDTAKSLCSTINRNLDEIVICNYVSLKTELPGSMLLENKTTDNSVFSIKSNNALTGSMFNADITLGQSAVNESFPNRIYYSKYLQPEAVPIVNSIDVGPKDKKILRILGLRDSLFIFKEDSIYRLTGYTSAAFQVILADSSSNLIAPDSASILNNQIYALTAQGVGTISESGVGIISRPIENIFNKITSPSYINFKKQCVGFGYEGDRSYIIFVPTTPEDTYATSAYRYNTFTQSWTSWDKNATCGLVESGSNKIFLGAGDINSIEVERKLLTSKDYVDRQYDRIMISYNLGFNIDNVSQIEIGDALVQTQYLSYVDYNRFIAKAKLDPSLAITPSFPEISNGMNLRDNMNNLVAELNSKDLSLINFTFDTSTIASNVITKTAHGLKNNDVIKFTGINPLTGLLNNEYYVVVNITLNTFQVANELSGTPLTISSAIGTATVNELYYTSNVEDFAQIQTDFNYNIAKLNLSSGAFFNNYELSEGTYEVGFLVSAVSRTVNRVNSKTVPTLFKGPITHYKGISSNVVYAPISLGEPAMTKLIRSGTLMIENYTLYGATLGYATDLSGAFEDIPFNLSGGTNWGDSVFGSVAWGGEGLAIPLRTLIPRNKQRCRYIKARFKHINAFEKFSILGISYTFETVSDRGYR